MSQEILPSTLPDEKESKGRRRTALTKEQQLHGVLRVMIHKNRQLQTPILAAKRLAKHTQFLKDEVERLKQRSFNYENGMIRAERRAAQLQQDLYRATRNGADGTRKEAEPTKKKSQGLPFYLPSSIQQLVDSLTAKNVALQKILLKAVDEPHAAKILEQNLQLESMVKVLREEIDLKASLLEHYESLVSETQPKDDAETLARNIIEQRKECSELKSKLRSYENYVKHLRERNSAIMDSIMTDLDKRNREPKESSDDMDEQFKEGEASGGGHRSRGGSNLTSCSTSANTSRATSRRESLRDMDAQTTECEFQTTGMQTDSGVSCTSSTRGSIDGTEIGLMYAANGAQTINMLENQIAMLKGNLRELEETCRAISEENERKQGGIEELNKRLAEEKKKADEFAEQQAESENILRMMQERVDNVNQEHAEVNTLRDQIREYQEKVDEIPLMQQVLQNYEEEIKSYGVERNQIIMKQEDLMRDNEHLLRENEKLKTNNEELHRHVAALIGRQEEVQFNQSQMQQHHYRFQQEQMAQPRHQRPMPARTDIPEPYQNQPWTQINPNQRAGVVSDGGRRGSSYQFDGQGPPRRESHQAQRERRMQQEQEPERKDFTSGFVSPDAGYTQDLDDDYSDYGTLKCENCGDRYPTSLFQEHFRDCSRDSRGNST